MPKIVQYNLPPGGTVVQLADNTSEALDIEAINADGTTDDYIVVTTTDSSESVTLKASGHGVKVTDSGAFLSTKSQCWSLLAEDASATNPNILPVSSDGDTGIGAAGADALSLVAGGVEGVRVTESGSAITAVDVNGPTAITHTAPSLTITNTTASDSHLARDGLIAFKGTQSGGEVTTLASITAEHFNASDDQKGVLTIAVNDGNDNDAPTDYLKLSTNQAEFNVKLKSKVGSEAEPGYAFYNDPNTGMFGDESDALGLSTAGVARVNIDAAGATTITGPTSTVGIFAITGAGTVGTGGSSDATLEQSGASTFQTALHVGAAIKIVDSGDGEVFLRTVASITDANTLEMDEAAVVENGSAWYHDGGELFAVKTGDSKTLFGVNETGAIQAGSAAADSSDKNNISIGDSDALDTLTTGERNIILGHSSNNYKLTTGIRNILAGYYSGEDIVTGASNTIIGDSAGTVVTLSDNTYIGAGSGLVCTGSENTAVGVQSGRAAGAASKCVAVGHSALYAATGNSNIGVGYQAGDTITDGTGNTILGYQCDTGASQVKSIAIGYQVAASVNQKAYIGDGSSATSIIFSGSGNSWTDASDSRIKENVVDTDLGLDFINALRPVKYTEINPQDWPEEIRPHIFFDKTKTRTNAETGEEEDYTIPANERNPTCETVFDGLIAQEVKAAADAAGTTFSGFEDNEANGKQGLQYPRFVVPLIKACQDLSSQVTALTARVAELEAGD